MRLRLICRERVGVVVFGLDVAKNPVISRGSGLYTVRVTVFAALFLKMCFRADEIVALGLQLNIKIA